MKNIAVFCSGGGTNFQSVIDAVEAGEIKANIACLVASKDNIGAIDRAKKHNIPYFVFDKSNYGSLLEMYGQIIGKLKTLNIDLIVFAGYLSAVTPDFIGAYNNRIINIHPSLLPKYGGKGMYGLKVHEHVINAKEKVSGCTVHYVDEGTDTGRIIAQTKVPVLENDTPESLQQRVLIEEHKLLIEVIQNLTK